MTWNSTGLLQHKDSLLVTLIEQKIVLCLISETHFTRESYLKLRGYDVYHAINPSNCAKGGNAVVIKTDILHYEDVRIDTKEFQVTSVKIKTTSGVLTVAALYSPLRHNLKRGDYLNLLQRFASKFMIEGDFNSKNTYWGVSTNKCKRHCAVPRYPGLSM
jgi:hypothetical protein